MSTALKIDGVSVEDYLAAEPAADVRHEYVGGKVFAMPGSSRNHNRITLNLSFALDSALAGGPCQVFANNVRVHLRADAADYFYYPDIMVACGPASHTHWVENPRVLIEVSSDSTERADRAEKLINYIQMESLEEYALISQKEPLVTIFRKKNGWSPELIQGMDAELKFDSLRFATKLARVYREVQW
jgi:Uma2 family endonuclease